MKARNLKPCLVALSLLACATAGAQTKSSADGIAEYRKMLEDGNPAELFEAKGEALWKEKRGPKNASLELCDLGKGAGIVKGAFVELPRYFADTNKVQDLESRLVSCMEALEGLDGAEIAKTPFGRGEQNNVTALATWVAAESRGLKFNLPQNHVEEKRSYEIGKRVFFFRGGTHDFSCASCHGEDGKFLNFGTGQAPRYIGTFANGSPGEFLHKVRFGHPGSSMPATDLLRWSAQDAADISVYSASLPQ